MTRPAREIPVPCPVLDDDARAELRRLAAVLRDRGAALFPRPVNRRRHPHFVRAMLEGAAQAIEGWLDGRIDGGAAEGAMTDWLPIERARKDGTVIWAVLHRDLDERTGRAELERWNGLQLPLRHAGLAEDGFDIGWNIAAPVGHGGFPDDWIAGWQPMPEGPR